MTKDNSGNQDFVNKQLDEATYRQKAFDDRFDNQTIVENLREYVNGCSKHSDWYDIHNWEVVFENIKRMLTLQKESKDD